MTKTASIDVSMRHLCRVLEDRHSGIKVKYFKDMETGLVRLLAATKPIEPIQFIEQRLSYDLAPWTRSWWATWIRRIVYSKWFKDWLVPYPIKCLAEAKVLSVSAKVDSIPESTVSSIYEQKMRLEMNGLEPYCIIIGRKRLDDVVLNSGPNYTFDVPISPSSHNEIYRTMHILGIPCFSYPFVAPETVIVIPKAKHD